MRLPPLAPPCIKLEYKPNTIVLMANNTSSTRYAMSIARLFTLADFERKSRANQPPDWHLKRVERLMALLGNPHLAKPVVHVAGSKGKGSTSAFIASVLTENGYRTGHYTSPHLHRFTERIAVDREPISKSHFASLVEQLWPYVDEIADQGDIGSVSVFEMLTAMAAVHFRDCADVDIAVVEVGLGGRLDATNLVQPVVSVITPISLDHVPILGTTIGEIAAEKAGIIKRGIPVVMGRQTIEAAAVIECQAEQMKSNLHNAMQEVTAYPPGDEGVENQYRGTANLFSDFGTVSCDLQPLGLHQVENASTAVTTLQVLAGGAFTLSKDKIERGLSATKWPCRTELLTLPNGVPAMLDGAHNDASARALVSTIRTHPDLKCRQVCLLLGATAGHDTAAVVREMQQIEPAWTIATSSRHPKSLPAAQVEAAVKDVGLNSTSRIDSVDAAMQHAKRIADDPDAHLIVATGSLFVAAEAREHILGINPELYDEIPGGYMQPYSPDPNAILVN